MWDLIIIFCAKYLYLVSIILGVLYLVMTKRTTQRRLVLLSIISFPISLITARILGIFIKDPRPFVVNHVTPLISHAADNGFPSDHTLLTMAIAFVIFTYNKTLGFILFFIALIVGVSRILAQIHHPIDILGSTIIALIVTFLGNLFLKFLIKNYPRSSATLES
jgi:undecaprenyl-diphosphatase